MKRYLEVLILPVFLTMISLFATAQELTFPQESSIPEWVALVFKQSGLSNRYIFSSRLNPFYQRGDFDGDGKQDIAIWIRELKSNKVGIAILNCCTEKISVIGAGNMIVDRAGKALWGRSEGGDSLDLIDAWFVYEKGIVEQGVGEASPPILKGDALMLIKTESASGLVYWTGKRYTWYQQGD
jgi:hypothetical protein